jgi:hypothetical protein
MSETTPTTLACIPVHYTVMCGLEHRLPPHRVHWLPPPSLLFLSLTNFWNPVYMTADLLIYLVLFEYLYSMYLLWTSTVNICDYNKVMILLAYTTACHF